MKSNPYFISSDWISIPQIYAIVRNNQRIELSPTIIPKIINCHRYLQQKISQ